MNTARFLISTLATLLLGCGVGAFGCVADADPAEGVADTAEAITVNGFGWQGSWVNTAGSGVHDPVIVQADDHSLHAFVRGLSGSLWEAHSSNGGSTWSSWNNGGGNLGGAPTAVAPHGDPLQDIYIFARGVSGGIYMRVFNWQTNSWATATDANGNPGTWVQLGTQNFTQDPVAAAFGTTEDGNTVAEQIDVFASGVNAATGQIDMWRASYAFVDGIGGDPRDLTDWNGWQDLGSGVSGASLDQPMYAAVGGGALGDGRVYATELVSANVSGQLSLKECTGSAVGQCSPWIPLPGSITAASAPSVTLRPSTDVANHPEVMVMGMDGHYYHSSFSGNQWDFDTYTVTARGTWSAWDSAGGTGFSGVGQAAPPTLLGWANNDLFAIVEGTNQNLFWNHRDLGQSSWDGWAGFPSNQCEAPGGRVAAVRSNDPADPNRITAIARLASGALLANHWDSGTTTSGNNVTCVCGGHGQTCCSGGVCGGDNVCSTGDICQTLH